MIRVSPPEEDRALPGPQVSSRVTRARRRNRYRAVHPPKAPAPITTILGFECMLVPTFDPKHFQHIKGAGKRTTQSLQLGPAAFAEILLTEYLRKSSN